MLFCKLAYHPPLFLTVRHEPEREASFCNLKRLAADFCSVTSIRFIYGLRKV